MPILLVRAFFAQCPSVLLHAFISRANTAAAVLFNDAAVGSMVRQNCDSQHVRFEKTLDWTCMLAELTQLIKSLESPKTVCLYDLSIYAPSASQLGLLVEMLYIAAKEHRHSFVLFWHDDLSPLKCTPDFPMQLFPASLCLQKPDLPAYAVDLQTGRVTLSSVESSTWRATFRFWSFLKNKYKQENVELEYFKASNLMKVKSTDAAVPGTSSALAKDDDDSMLRQLATFNVSLTDQQRASKEQLELPYIKAQSKPIFPLFLDLKVLIGVF